MSKLPVVTIVGRPNVGKSTLFNRLLGFRQAVISKVAGTTRDPVAEKIEWNGKSFVLVDTAGLLTDFFDLDETDILREAQEKLREAISESDVIIFLVDIKTGITEQDKKVAQIIRPYEKRTLLVFNKADNLRYEKLSEAESSLGFKEHIPVSSISGKRTGDLLDLLTRDLSRGISSSEKDLTKITIIGRPNVGKSTLFNSLIGSKRSIVSEIPGTTRDSLKFAIRLENADKKKNFEIIDTAGLRRRGKIVPGVEKFSVIRSINSIIVSDLVIVVVDASEGITRQDAHLVQLALDKRKKVIVAVNKIDLLQDNATSEIKDFHRFPFILKLPVVGISAKNETNLDLLIRELFRI